jgi:hypothetical protein
MKGLYVDFWRNPGLHSKEEMQALNSYCIDNGISDVYVFYKKDKFTNKIMYFLENQEPPFYYLEEAKTYLTQNLHLWLSILLLFRKKNAIEIDPNLATMEFNNKVYLDPVDEYTRDYIVDYINSFDYDNIHLDRLWYPMMSDVGQGSRQDKINALTDIVSRVRQANPDKHITVPILTHELFDFGVLPYGLNDWKSWLENGYINKVVPIILGATSKNLDMYLEESRKHTDTVAIYTSNQEALDKANDMNIILFSYGTADI